METSEEIKESEEGKILCSAKMATKIHSVILENVIAHLHKILVEKVTSQSAFYVNLYRAVIGPSGSLTGR